MPKVLTNPEDEEVTIIPTIAESWRVPTEAIQEAVDAAIDQLGPFVGTDGTKDGSTGLVPAPTTADANKYLKSDGTWGEGGNVTLYDTTGQNTDGAMTQKATTDALGGKQNALTAGANIQINNNTISATDTTYSDFTGTDGTTAGASGLVPAPATTDADKFLKADGTWDEVAGGIPTDATFWGQSYDAANNKVSGNIDLGGGTKSIINDSSISNSGALFLANGAAAIAIRTTTLNSAQYRFEELAAYFSSPLYMAQRNTAIYHQIKSMADPTDPQDAATKNYTDNLVISYSAIEGSSAPTTSTEGKYVGQLYFDTTNDKKYYLKAIDTTTDPDEYEWEEFGGGIPADATFWGASYDAVNNKVEGNLIMPSGLSGIRGLWAYDASNAPKIGFDVNNRPKIDYYGDLLFTVPSSANENTLFEFSGTTAGQRINLKGATDSQTLRISGVTDPTNPQDAATKNYVDTNLPSVGDATLTIQKNGVDVQTFTANSTTNATADIAVPTTVAELDDASDYAYAADLIQLESSLAEVALTGSHNDLRDIPTIDATISASSTNAVQNQAVASALANKADSSSIGNGTLTIKRNGTSVATFSANSSTAAEADISVPTAVSQLSDASSYYTKTQVDDAISGAVSASLKYKGSCTFANLPASGMQVGDVWNITDDFTLDGEPYTAGTNVAWNGTKWDPLAPAIDLSPYALSSSIGNGTITVATTTANVDTFTTNQSANKTITIPAATASAHGTVIVDSALSASSNNPVRNSVIYAAIGDIETILNTLNSGTGA